MLELRKILNAKPNQFRAAAQRVIADGDDGTIADADQSVGQAAISLSRRSLVRP
jgi:hypothetical protein